MKNYMYTVKFLDDFLDIVVDFDIKKNTRVRSCQMLQALFLYF